MMLVDLFDPMVTQWLVFLFMAVAFVIGVWFVTPYNKKHPHIRVNVTRNERKAGYRYCLSSEYARYRNPMRILRRFSGWPTGRQWVKLRKYWNREYPNGAERFATVVATAHVNHHMNASPAPKEVAA